MGISLFSFLSQTQALADYFTPSVGASALQYATDTSLTTRLDASLNWKSETTLPEDSRIAVRELHFQSFFESGPLGDKSFDLDSTVVRFNSGDEGHFWLGRVHPFLEGRPGERLSQTEAIGANWVQNQSNALEPSISGWIGGGLHKKIGETGFHYTGAFSPIFLPSFGPRVTLDEINEPTASRFGSTPPQYYILENGTVVPMRYRIQIGSLASIVFQPQAYVSGGYSNQMNDITVMAWSAPSPTPQVTTNGMMRPTPPVPAVLVNVNPSFPRENFLGARWAVNGLLLNPVIEGVFETVSVRFSLSAKIRPFSFFEAGILHTWDQPPPPSDQPTVDSPSYRKHLVWGQFNFAQADSLFVPSLRLEGNFTPQEEGYWIKPMLTYNSNKQMKLYAAVNLIGGQDRGYFGTWQSLDFVSMGAIYQW